jgi:hypothetical protein
MPEEGPLSGLELPWLTTGLVVSFVQIRTLANDGLMAEFISKAYLFWPSSYG